MRTAKKFFCAVLVITILSCSHSHYNVSSYSLPKTSTMAVGPFKNLTTYPEAENIVSEIMTVELTQKKIFKIVDLPKEASHLLTGTITEFRYTKGLAEAPAVALQVKLIESKSGKVVWRASGSDLSTESIFARSASLDELTHNICASLVSSLVAE